VDILKLGKLSEQLGKLLEISKITTLSYFTISAHDVQEQIVIPQIKIQIDQK
tara:strand:+ start:121 stop:276 length:156 start_codon:yes stop_codon:yes gene_type:complete